MSEEKINETNTENNQDSIIDASGFSGLFDSEEIQAQPEENETKPEKKSKKKRNKKEEKQQIKKEKAEKYPSKLSFLLGLVVLIFALIGMVLTGYYAVSYIDSTYETGSEYARYNSFLTPVAAVDIDHFDDITAADTKQLLNASIWLILSNDSTPDTYSYSGGYMLIPDADVEAAYKSIFGPETVSSIVHQTINGYNCVFEYDGTLKVYKIPVTTISPVYTPNVTDVSQSGSSVVITVEYLAAESWAKDDEGNFVAPAPDKVMKITLRELQGSYYISSVNTISATVPETVTFQPVTAVPETTTVQETTTSSETTTSKSAERTTLAGRVP